MKQRSMIRRAWACGLLLALLFACACGDDDDDNDDVQDDDAQDDDEQDDDSEGDDDTTDDDGPYYDPTWAVTTDILPPVREWADIRGIIHSHSIYSHDACDGEPVGNTECLAQKRAAFCQTRQDYVMLTDHDDSFAEIEYPNALLHDGPARDRIYLDGDGLQYANRLGCEDGSFVTVFAGTENDIMPLHMHRHVDGTVEDRYAVYGRRDAEAADLLRETGALVVVNHPELWSIDELVALAPDGVEVFNLHAAIDPDLREQLGVPPLSFASDLLMFLRGDAHPELAIVTFWPETTAWTDRWDALLARGRSVGVIATDDHRNALPFVLADGDRADSFRRMEHWFSNHLFVASEEPVDIEDALDRGRGYMAFEFLGMPIGFDFHLDADGTVYEMGDEVSADAGAEIVVQVPEPFMLDPDSLQPEIRARIVHVAPDGTRRDLEVDGQTTYTADQPGAYRAEVFIIPTHLLPWLGADPWEFVKEYPWIISNPVYVTEP